MDNNRSIYEKSVQDRSQLRYLIGLLLRWKQNIKYSKARRIARKRGAKIGDGVIMSKKLARKMNKNVEIGSHVSIGTDKIDTRSPLKIGNNVIIGSGTQIITTSHNIDSPNWEHKHYGLEIEDYVWIPTSVMILPSCRRIGRGAVVGSGSVVVKNVEPMSVISGNPAKEFRKRSVVHSSHVVEANRGGDYHIYKSVRKRKENR